LSAAEYKGGRCAKFCSALSDSPLNDIGRVDAL